MINYLVEEKFRGYSWCQRMIRIICCEARKKRLEVREIPKLDAADPDAGSVLLMGASQSWINSMADRAMKMGYHPVALSNRQLGGSRMPLSAVMMDVHGSMQLAVDYLKSLGKHSIALYGVNPNASSDPWRVERFEAIGGRREDVFFLVDTLEQTFEQFYALAPRYDAVICASDYAAVSLLRRLQQKNYKVPEKLYIVSYGNMKLSQLVKPSITSISDAYDEFGMAALSLCALVEKSDMIANVILYLRCRLYIRQTTENRPYVVTEQPQGEGVPANNQFFQDAEVARLAALENLFCQCDEVDRQLIQLLFEHQSSAAMAQACFISESAVKYRIHKMEKICGAASREALIQMLSAFFEPNTHLDL